MHEVRAALYRYARKNGFEPRANVLTLPSTTHHGCVQKKFMHLRKSIAQKQRKCNSLIFSVRAAQCAFQTEKKNNKTIERYLCATIKRNIWFGDLKKVHSCGKYQNKIKKKNKCHILI